MKLYKVISSNFYKPNKFIIALNKAIAINKYYELVNVYEDSNVTATYFCDRDELIPTTEFKQS